MRVLGICHDVLIASAAIVENGEVLAAVPEERLDRQKQSRGFPALAVSSCLQQAGLSLEDIDEIAIAWNPAIDVETVPAGFVQARRHRSEHLYQVPAQFMKLAGSRAADSVTITNAAGGVPPITFIGHYDAHVGNSYFMTGWEESAVLVMDGRAERQTTLLGHAHGTEVRRIAEVNYPQSLGLLYGTITQFLGFRPDSDEWKVMALGSASEAENEFTPLLRNMIHVAENGTFRLALEYFEFYNQFDRRMYSDLFVATVGAPRSKDDELTEGHERLAAAMQLVFEETAASVLRSLHAQTGSPRVALSGGCFMNSVFNGKVTELTPFEEVFISSCPDDSGTAVGAALFLEASRTGTKRTSTSTVNYWGPSYTDQECHEVAVKCRLPNVEVVADPSARAAADLVDGRIIGWFQDRMEFGQRALGNRSILLDPRREDGKDIVNAAVKFRESFRPFAPAILAEHAAEWFECPDNASVPFMERVYRFRPEKAERVPAVVHTDGTGRLQTVTAPDNPRYHALITEFQRLTGVPIVLNTSFNLNGEPIVCTPDDAIRTFYSCALDVLYLGNVRISK